jgi:hypothetical protein
MIARRIMTIAAQFPPWVMALLLSGVFFSVNGYKFGWDDQHLEIPLLTHLIDPAFFAGDYYVESLAKNFSSFFYLFLAKIISVHQIPAAYFLLYIISRYFLIYWIYKIWLHVSHDKFKAVACTLVFILMARVHEFLYRTFSHQEFALAIIFAGIYYFLKERYILSALILGVAANFHALYSFFPMFYVGIYLLWDIRRIGWKKAFLAILVYVACAAPFVVWTLKNKLAAGVLEVSLSEWLPLYVTACPQNFFFPAAPVIPWKVLVSNWNVFYYFFQPYIYLTVLFLLNIFFNDHFRRNKRAISFCLGAVALLIISFIFTYAYPNRFVLDLNLIRNSQYLSFMLMGFTTLLFIDIASTRKAVFAFIMGVLFAFLKFNYPIMTSSILILMAGLALEKVLQCKRGSPNQFRWKALGFGFLVIISALLFVIVQSFYLNEFNFSVRVHLTIIFCLLTLFYFFIKNKEWRGEINLLYWKRLFIAIPLLVFFSQYSLYHYRKVKMENTGDGFWKLQRSWEDMQRFVRQNTAQDALIMIPYDMEMCGFRIQSQRKVLVSYRDCGIIGFDYAAAQEWKKRIVDIQAYKTFPKESFLKALKNGIVRYKSDYVVFVRFAAPQTDLEMLERVYTNEEFVLFKVKSR